MAAICEFRLNRFDFALFQLINIEYNGTVEKKEVREDGQHTITIDNKSPLFKFVQTNKYSRTCLRGHLFVQR